MQTCQLENMIAKINDNGNRKDSSKLLRRLMNIFGIAFGRKDQQSLNSKRNNPAIKALITILNLLRICQGNRIRHCPFNLGWDKIQRSSIY